MNISAEAVEAARGAFVAARGTLDDHLLAILSAASPVLTKQASVKAWDAGYEVGLRFGANTNPYRAAGAKE